MLTISTIATIVISYYFLTTITVYYLLFTMIVIISVISTFTIVSTAFIVILIIPIFSGSPRASGLGRASRVWLGCRWCDPAFLGQCVPSTAWGLVSGFRV